MYTIYIYIYIYIIQIYNIASPELISTKLVILPAAGGLPPEQMLIADFVLSLSSGLDMLYIYIIYVYICIMFVYMYICIYIYIYM